ncbi:MAG: hypothetical protein V2A58_04220 [Planctomycetota bacterium]
MRETERIREAFRYYCSLGCDASYAQVAREFHVSRHTVERWGYAFRWVERACGEPPDAARSDDAAPTPRVGPIDPEPDVRQLVRIALRTFVRWLADREARNEPACDSISELEKLVKLDLLLSGDDRGRAGAEEVVLRFSPRPVVSMVEGADARELSPQSLEDLSAIVPSRDCGRTKEELP